MLVNLNKYELIALIRGSYIPFELIDNELKDYVTYNNHYGRLSWDKQDLNSLEEDELIKIYKTIKSSKEHEFKLHKPKFSLVDRYRRIYNKTKGATNNDI